MQANPIDDWQRLTAHYRQLNDDELRELASDFTGLTETAQQALRSEMQTRGLGNPAAVIPAPELPRTVIAIDEASQPNDYAPQAADSIVQRALLAFGARPPQLVPDTPDPVDEDNGPHDYTWKTLLCKCDTSEAARQVQEVLRRVGIDSWIDRPQDYSPNHARLVGLPSLELIGMAGPRVLVAADQLDQARAIAAQPIPPEIVAESEAKVPDFEAPSCPNCGAADPILMGVDPANSWKCEQCGRQWTDSAPPDASKAV